MDCMEQQSPVVLDWQAAVQSGELGLWDLRPRLETVHHSAAWKLRLGFPDPHAADSTHFWRCRVHPDDLEPMLAAMRQHLRGAQPHYEAVFRLRSNGSGYRRLQSRGRVVERAASGHALRIVGTMIDLTERPATPASGLPAGLRGPTAGLPVDLPFHLLLGADPERPPDPACACEGRRLLGEVKDLVTDSLAQLLALGR